MLETALTERPATLLCRSEERPSPETLAKLPTLRLLECAGTNPAQLWNLGVASGDAPLAHFLACGSIPASPGAVNECAPAFDESVVLAQPIMTVRGQTPTLGMREERGLVLRAAPAPARGEPGASEIPELDAVAPEAFFLQRGNASRVGPFDEDMQGSLALLEYCLRAKARGYLVVGLPESMVDLSAQPGRGLESGADKIVLLARHRPGEALRALVADQSVWERPEAELRAFVHAVLSRLPNVAGAGVGVLADELIGLRQNVLSIPVVASLTHPIERVLNDALGIASGNQRKLPDARLVLEQVLEKARRLAARADEREREAELTKGQYQRAQQEAQSQHTRAQARTTELEEVRRRGQQQLLDLAAAQARIDQLESELAKGQKTLQELISSADRAATVAQQEHDVQVAATAEATRSAEHLQHELGRIRSALAAETAAHSKANESLHERESWVVLLLGELAQRGIKLRPRKLTEQEQRFLNEHRERR